MVAAAAEAAATAATMNPAAVALPEMLARDTLIAWYRGEFAAANAIIDALCSHLVQISDRPSDYEAVFAAIHRRRMNWIPVLHMQRFFSIAEVANELRRVANGADLEPPGPAVEAADAMVPTAEGAEIDVKEEISTGRTSNSSEEEYSSGDSSDRNIAGDGVAGEASNHGGSTEGLTSSENFQICSNHEECMGRSEKIKLFKGFVAKEPVKGHMVNVVKGLKLYEDIFTNSELHNLREYVNELRFAGRNGELSGETFIFFNKQMKGKKREIIQLGVPLFQSTKLEATTSIEPIPHLLLSVIDHLTQWRLLPETKRPNSCVINFFDENEYSQPYLKPPHLENPISTLFLSDTTMTFGRVLTSDENGDYKGSLTLPLSEGSLLLLRGNSADMAKHVICPSPIKRVIITFLKVRPSANQSEPLLPSTSPQSQSITICQPTLAAAVIAPGPLPMVPQLPPHWGISLRAPVFMFGPKRPLAISPERRRITRGGGTGVFLPWSSVVPRRYNNRQIPPRIQKRRLPALLPPLEAH